MCPECHGPDGILDEWEHVLRLGRVLLTKLLALRAVNKGAHSLIYPNKWQRSWSPLPRLSEYRMA